MPFSCIRLLSASDTCVHLASPPAAAALEGRPAAVAFSSCSCTCFCCLPALPLPLLFFFLLLLVLLLLLAAAAEALAAGAAPEPPLLSAGWAPARKPLPGSLPAATPTLSNSSARPLLPGRRRRPAWQSASASGSQPSCSSAVAALRHAWVGGLGGSAGVRDAG